MGVDVSHPSVPRDPRVPVRQMVLFVFLEGREVTGARKNLG